MSRLSHTVFAQLPALIKAGSWLASLLLAGYWLTQWTAPRPVAALPTTTMASFAAGPSQAIKIFGVAQQATGLPSGLTLNGLFRAADTRGFATFITPEGPRSALVGDEILPGVRLQALKIDHVVLLVGAVEHRLALASTATGDAPLSASGPNPGLSTNKPNAKRQRDD